MYDECGDACRLGLSVTLHKPQVNLGRAMYLLSPELAKDCGSRRRARVRDHSSGAPRLRNCPAGKTEDVSASVLPEPRYESPRWAEALGCMVCANGEFSKILCREHHCRSCGKAKPSRGHDPRRSRLGCRRSTGGLFYAMQYNFFQQTVLFAPRVPAARARR